MMYGWVYAIELPNGNIKFGFTGMVSPRERFFANDCKYGPGLRPIGVVRGQWGHERELLKLLRPWRVAGEIFAPSKIVRAATALFPPWTVTPRKQGGPRRPRQEQPVGAA